MNAKESIKETQPIPNEVWDDLQYEIDRQGLEFADSFRAYRRRGSYLKEQFEAARGCCGSWEGQTVVNGEVWIIGCNYGH